MKKKKYKLLSTDEFDFVLIGIVSSDKIYKLSWHLKNILGIEFCKTEDLIITFKKQDVIKIFEVFASSTNISDSYYTIISNKSENGFLLNQFKNIDYILKIAPAIIENKVIETIDNIYSLDSVLSIFSIDLNLLKDKEKQYFVF